MTINEGNELIEGFLFPNEILGWYRVESCIYHDSYNIMQAVEKIESLGYPVYIVGNSCTIYEKVGKDHGWMIDKYGKTKIEAVWLAVVEYCKQFK